MEAAQFLRDVIEAVPDRIHTMLTDNSLPQTRSGGVQFTPRKHHYQRHGQLRAHLQLSRGHLQ